MEPQDSAERSVIKGKFREGKRRYGLGRFRARPEQPERDYVADVGDEPGPQLQTLFAFYLPLFEMLISQLPLVILRG